MGINGDKRNGVFSGFIPQNPEIRGRGRGYTSLEVRGGDGDGGKQNFWGFLGEKPRKSSIFGAGTGDTISGILPTLVPNLIRNKTGKKSTHSCKYRDSPLNAVSLNADFA